MIFSAHFRTGSFGVWHRLPGNLYSNKLFQLQRGSSEMQRLLLPWDCASDGSFPHYGPAGQNTPRGSSASNGWELAKVIPLALMLILQGMLLIQQELCKN